MVLCNRTSGETRTEDRTKAVGILREWMIGKNGAMLRIRYSV
jgi:hypothetical protein